MRDRETSVDLIHVLIYLLASFLLAFFFFACFLLLVCLICFVFTFLCFLHITLHLSGHFRCRFEISISKYSYVVEIFLQHECLSTLFWRQNFDIDSTSRLQILRQYFDVFHLASKKHWKIDIKILTCPLGLLCFAALLYSTLLCSTLLYSTPLHSTLYSTLLGLLYSTLLYSTYTFKIISIF